MSHKLIQDMDLMYDAPLVKTASYTLTVGDLKRYPNFVGNHASDAIAFTLTPAVAGLEGVVRKIACLGAAAVTVVVAAGFGGVGSGGDTLTLAQGEYVEVWCDGTYWYNNQGTAAS